MERRKLVDAHVFNGRQEIANRYNRYNYLLNRTKFRASHVFM